MKGYRFKTGPIPKDVLYEDVPFQPKPKVSPEMQRWLDEQRKKLGGEPNHPALKAGDMITQDAADYTDDGPDPDERCAGCTMFREPDACTLVEGDIHPGGHCRYFQAKDDARELER